MRLLKKLFASRASDGDLPSADLTEILDTETGDLEPTAPAPESPSQDLAGEDAAGADDDTVTVYDPGWQSNVSISGNVLTAPGGPSELSESYRQLLIASSEGHLYYSRSHAREPRLRSEIARLEMVHGAARTKQAVDMSSLSELYHRTRQRTRSGAQTKRNDQSKMQRALMSIVAGAAAKNASDVHIIVNSDRAVTRARIDGVMVPINEMQPQYAYELLSAAFVMADASDPSYQQRQYQGARISSLTTELPSGVQSLRLQFNPLANEGRYLVMRILYSGSETQMELSDLGYSSEQIRQINTMSARPVGINVISGPTGSGKSTTLKTILEGVIRKRRGEINTITIEDPPEYVINSAQQMPVVNAKTQEERAAAFTQAISAGLRSDPNIMMIGEIRDRASADLAVEGALSGHPIYASLHANTAMDILSRLRDMGIEDFKVFDPTVFSGLVGQRLMRQLCPHCRRPIDSERDTGRIDELALERIDRMIAITPAAIFDDRKIHVAGDGCDHCSGGYKSRAVIAEIILPDDTFMNFMAENRKTDARNHWFEKMQGLDLLGSSWISALEGRVSPIDIENDVALMDPVEAHKDALDYWTRRLGMLG